KVGGVGLVILGVPHPELELDLVIGPIDGPIGDGEHLGGVVLGVILPAIPDAAEAEVGEALGPALSVLGLAGGDQPLHGVVGLVVAAEELPVLVRLGVEGVGDDAPLVGVGRHLLLAIAEELDVGLVDRLAGDG